MDLSKLLQKYENKWVALSQDFAKVVASGDTVSEIESKLTPKEVHEVVFFKVPRFDAVFVPLTL